jgi:hypothetical protein
VQVRPRSSLAVSRSEAIVTAARRGSRSRSSGDFSPTSDASNLTVNPLQAFTTASLHHQALGPWAATACRRGALNSANGTASAEVSTMMIIVK